MSKIFASKQKSGKNIFLPIFRSDDPENYDLKIKSQDSAKAYIVATGFVIFTFIIKLILDPVLKFQEVPYLLSFVSVVLTASYGGVVPGCFATIFSSILTNFLFVGDGLKYDFLFKDTMGSLRLTTFLIEGFFTSILIGQLKISQKKAVLKSELLNNSERQLRKVLNSLFVFVGVIKKDGTVIESNRASLEAAGLRSKDVFKKALEKTYWWAYSENSKNRIRQAIEKAGKGNRVRFDWKMRLKNDKYVVVDFSISPVKNDNGEVEYLVSSAVDVNERVLALDENKKLYLELKTQNKKIDTLISNIPGIVWEIKGKPANSGMAVSFVSDYAEKMLGYKQEDWEKDPDFWIKTISPEDRLYVLKELDEIYTKKEGKTLQFKLLTKNGGPIWVEARFVVNDDGYRNSPVIEAVIMDISERIKLEQTKDEFVGIASHEIKTPITTIKAFAQILEKRFRKINDIQSLNYLFKMNNYISKLTTIINDFLDFSKIQSGKLEYYKEEVDVDSLVGEVVADMQPITEDHRIDLNGSTGGKVLGDKNRIAQVLINLISNAAKYSPEAGIIKIGLKQDNKNIIISVTDYGIGIAKKSQRKIFERFYRVSNPKKIRIEGFGLGLYIAKEIIKRHKGKIWVESRLNKGSTFYVSLPKISSQLLIN